MYQFLDHLANVLDEEFQKGTVSMPSVDISVVAGSLSFAHISGYGLAVEIGNKCASYWSSNRHFLNWCYHRTRE